MFQKMDSNGNAYYINRKKSFAPQRYLKSETIKLAFDFAYSMTFSEAGEHRDHRSGGTYHRRKSEIFANTFQGKLAECSLYNEMTRRGFEATKPDFSVYGLGEWDDVDIIINDKNISIKSTKSFGNLLLLETKDWDSEARYIPNDKAYDFTFLIRMNPFCEDLLRKNKLLYTDRIDKQLLFNLISKNNWQYDIAGFITKEDLKQIISEKHVIPKGSLLNGSTRMDAENYYVQSGCMRPIESFIP